MKIFEPNELKEVKRTRGNGIVLKDKDGNFLLDISNIDSLPSLRLALQDAKDFKASWEDKNKIIKPSP